MKKFIKELNKFTLAAHRGASIELPENTYESFKRAIDIYPDCMLELDVWGTKDGKIVVSHDGILDLNTNMTGFIKDRTYGELKKADAGYNITFDNGKSYPFRGKGFKIVTLDYILKEFPSIKMSIDIKYNNINFAKNVIELIKNYKSAERIIIGSFHKKIVKWVRKQYPDLVTAFDKNEVIIFYLLQKLGALQFYNFKGDILMVPEYSGEDKPEELGRDVKQGIRIVSPVFIKSAQEMGYPVFVWTINQRENMKRLIKWGVNGIVTDNPETLRDIMFVEGIIKTGF